MVTLSVKKWRKKLSKIKLTTRITISNVVLFSLLVLLIIYFVTLLTRQFLFYKNRDDLDSKLTQVEDYLTEQSDSIQSLSGADRITFLSDGLGNAHLFQDYKFILLISDTENNAAYLTNKAYYDNLFYEAFYISPDNVQTNVTYLPSQVPASPEILDVSVSVPELGDDVNFLNLRISLPASGNDPVTNQVKVLGRNLVYTAMRYDDNTFLTLFLYSELDDDFIISLNSALLISALIGIILISVFGKYFTRRALKPLVELSYIAQNIDKETLNYRIPSSDSNDEVDTLIKSLNLMLQNLELSFESQKQFVSDASHELRIPLTVILGYIDILKSAGYDDRSLLEESIQAIGDEAQNMKRLMEKLLLLARVENKRFEIHPERIGIVDFINKLVAESALLYPNYTFESHCKYKGFVVADTEVLMQMVRALIENAVKYSPQGSLIRIETASSPRTYILSVIDAGCGIPKAHLNKLTDRFYRVDADRNRASGGSGLGLSIVDGLIKTHGGHLQITSTEGEGTCVSLHLPTTLTPTEEKNNH